MLNEQQLTRWAQAPSPTEMAKIKKTREIIEEKIKQNLPILEIKQKHNLSMLHLPEVYLQGSYANSTNIRFDSDVDIVVQLNNPFYSNTDGLSEEEKQRYKTHFFDSSYRYEEFKDDIYAALEKAFGKDVEYAPKCLKIAGNTNRVKADVVPCMQYRCYKRFISYGKQDYIEGIKFYNTDDGKKIINYPKKHLENCESKNIDTDTKFKSLVRIFKNIKRDLVEASIIDEKVAPSYFVENLIYNCSSPCFDGNYSECMRKTFQFLVDAIDSRRITGFVCANEQNSLFSTETWNLDNAQLFIIKAGNYFLNE